MAEWTGKKVNKSQLNGGEEYNLDSDVAIEELNAIVNNSLYSSKTADDARMKASEALQNSQSALADGINPNLLINSDFRVNQKGQTNYNVNSLFTVDAWKLIYGSLAINSDGSVTHTSTNTWQGIRQYIKNPSRLAGKTVTFSMRANSTSTRFAQLNLTKSGASNSTVLGNTKTVQTGESISSFTATIPSDTTDDDSLFVLLYTPQANQSVTYYWTKLEIGSIATAYSPKPYEQELADCQVIEGGFATTYSNPNLLINGDFRVNQRGQSSYSGTGVFYTVDRWGSSYQQVTIDVIENGGIKITSGTDTFGIVCQYIETYIPPNTPVTLSAKVDGVIYTFTGTTPSSYSSVSSYFCGSATQHTRVRYVPNKGFQVELFPGKGLSCVVEWIKFELGSVATAFSPRPYAEELALCQRYYQVIKVKGGSGTVGHLGVPRNTTTLRFYINLLQELRTAPTILNSGISIINLSTGTIKAIADNSLTLQSLLNNMACLSYATTGLTLGQIYNLTDSDGSLTISLDAEIY